MREDDLREQFRAALRGVASSVIVVSTGDGDKRHAMAATSVMSVSMEPPSMAFAIHRDASAYPTLLSGAGFCINVLDRRHKLIARECSGELKGEKRFARGDFDMEGNGIPYLRTAQANIVCAQDGRYLYGTHALIIGKVRSVRVGEGADPLIYFNGDYAKLAFCAG